MLRLSDLTARYSSQTSCYQGDVLAGRPRACDMEVQAQNNGSRGEPHRVVSESYRKREHLYSHKTYLHVTSMIVLRVCYVETILSIYFSHIIGHGRLDNQHVFIVQVPERYSTFDGVLDYGLAAIKGHWLGNKTERQNCSSTLKENCFTMAVQMLKT